MKTIRAILIAASASCALAGCSTSSDGVGGMFASLGSPAAPLPEPRNCVEVAKEAVLLGARARLTLQLPGRDVREGPSGSVIVPWPDPASVGSVNAEVGREMVKVRHDAEFASCPVFFDTTGNEVPLGVTPAPVGPVAVVSEIPPPAAPLPANPAPVVADPVAPAAATRSANRSAWTDVPASGPASASVAASTPSEVAGGNPALEPPRVATGKTVASGKAGAPKPTPPTVVAARPADRPAKPEAVVESDPPPVATAQAKPVPPTPPKPRSPRVIPITPPAPAQRPEE